MTSQLPAATESVIVGRSARMRAVFEFLHIIGDSDSTVLVTGESGTGKEVTAAVIHQNSRRHHHPFVAVSCALFSETLIESELFGHERGAFTGAIKDRPGRFEMAEGGTIFLDDIDDVPLAMQVKLLRVLQNRTIERLGGTRTIPVNVRVIAGTKRDLKQLVTEGKFREDLFYRLNVLPVTLPPLRERPEDIPVLMEHFLQRYFRRRDEDVPAVSDAVVQAFMRLLVAGQRSGARERLRAYRPDVHVRNGARGVYGGEHPVPGQRAAHAGAGAPARGDARRGGRWGEGARRSPADCAGLRPPGHDEHLARRPAPRGGVEPHRLGAESERRQQVESGSAAADQAIDAGRSDQPLRTRPGGRGRAWRLTWLTSSISCLSPPSWRRQSRSCCRFSSFRSRPGA